MSTIATTLSLYRDSATDAARGLARSAWAVAALVVAYAVTVVASLLVAPLGMLGGILMGFLQAVLVGWYLSLVEIGVGGRRRVAFADLRGNVGAYWQPVISVMFVFWIGSFLLQITAPQALPIVVTVCALLFNPAPEMIYSEHTQSTALLEHALRFMQENWPEWLGGVAIGAAFLAAWGALVYGGLEVRVLVQLVEAFGPFFGFVQIGGFALATFTAGGFVGAVVLLVFTHFFLLFRGHLYRRLRHSSRRARAWQARLK